MMQLHSGAELFGKVIYRGIITRGCSYWCCCWTCAIQSRKCLRTVNDFIIEGEGGGIVLARQSLEYVRNIRYNFLKSEMYIPKYLQCTLHSRPQLNFFLFSSSGLCSRKETLTRSSICYSTHVISQSCLGRLTSIDVSMWYWDGNSLYRKTTFPKCSAPVSSCITVIYII